MRHLLFGLLLLVCAAAIAAGEEDAKGPSRSELEIPDDVWSSVLDAVDRSPERPIGYTRDEMALYGRDRHLLRPVANLFRDARRIPRETGRWTSGLLAHAADPMQVVYRGFLMLDVAAGRRLRPPAAEDASAFVPDGVSATAWERYPESVRRLIARLVHAGHEAAPWLARAYHETLRWREAEEEAPMPPAVRAFLDEADLRSVLYRLATSPWQDEENDQVATWSRASFGEFEKTDYAYLAYASAVFFGLVRDALAEYDAAESAPVPEDLEALSFVVEGLGFVHVFGDGTDVVDVPEQTFLTVDLGGDDGWTGILGSPTWLAAPISLHLDLAGDDTYRASEPGRIACGLYGIGAVIDRSGNDEYWNQESGLGCAWHGVGLLLDEAGNDAYRTQGAWGQGAAHGGVGALVDLAGDDLYECGEQSQGLGSTLGAGLLVDVAGDDRYVARDDGNVSSLYRDQSVAMSQGCGYGRRADLGDGHSLAGGVGILLDGAGDDHYHAQVWAQGCGYWWGLGILEDRGGNDTYRNGKYSAGAAAHFAIGVCWDRAGDDRYTYRPSELGAPNGWSDTGPLGTATRYEPFHSTRDEIPSWGVFLDTGGKDVYETLGEPEGVELLAADAASWVHQDTPTSRGVGIDLGSDAAVAPAAPNGD